MAEVIRRNDGDSLVLIRVNGKYLVETRFLNGYYTVFSTYDYDKAVAYWEQLETSSFTIKPLGKKGGTNGR